jgi:thiol-disulfide isomerase/thioredoxin
MSAFGQRQDFVLKGKIKGQDSGMLKLSYLGIDGAQVQDSAAIHNGIFEFKGKLTEPAIAYFSGAVKSRAMDDPNVGYFFLEPATMTLEVTAGDFKNLKLAGSKTQAEFAELEKLKSPVSKEMKPVLDAYQRANEAYVQARKDSKSEAELDALKEKAAAIRDQFDPFNERKDKVDLAFIKSHPDSYYSAYMLRWKVSGMPLAESKVYYEKLSPGIKYSSYGKAIQKEIKGLEGGSPGSVAAVFSVRDINDEQLSLAGFKGKKYVLLDFWASWCVPCRKGNPHLLSLYSKYKDKGLEIVGVSDDDSAPEAWKKAVAKDGIGVWKHVLRGLKRRATGYDTTSDISAPFGIHTLPTKILIDKEGIIVGRYGGGGEGDEAMDKKLAEIFN